MLAIEMSLNVDWFHDSQYTTNRRESAMNVGEGVMGLSNNQNRFLHTLSEIQASLVAPVCVVAKQLVWNILFSCGWEDYRVKPVLSSDHVQISILKNN